MKWVHELSNNELEELRQTYFLQLLDEGKHDMLMDIEYATDMPMDRVIKHYKDTFFVDEDFFCNIK